MVFFGELHTDYLPLLPNTFVPDVWGCVSRFELCGGGGRKGPGWPAVGSGICRSGGLVEDLFGLFLRTWRWSLGVFAFLAEDGRSLSFSVQMFVLRSSARLLYRRWRLVMRWQVPRESLDRVDCCSAVVRAWLLADTTHGLVPGRPKSGGDLYSLSGGRDWADAPVALSDQRDPGPVLRSHLLTLGQNPSSLGISNASAARCGAAYPRARLPSPFSTYSNPSPS
ncbi:hypothetical protein B0T14DRAFT_18672 [Immersiella caudata]|uniref:Uncharacterized protein n=1 Tax=Immersiella caudata TaxID=314043 RepID=A0AA40CB88_9PEZI|nr:hypothetical protein B0T14DRAFT_18672 [Immersiella caudata]